MEVSTIDLTNYNVTETKVMPLIGEIPFPIKDSCKHMNVSHLQAEHFTSAFFSNSSDRITWVQFNTNTNKKIAMGWPDETAPVTTIDFAFNETKVGFYGNFNGS